MKVHLSGDTAHVAEIREKLKQSGGYCPCQIGKTPDTKCMCKMFRDQIAREESGECHCGLYVAEKE